MVLGGEGYALALELLTEAATAGGLTPDAARVLYEDARAVDAAAPDLRDTLGVLEHDGYLRQKGTTYIFVSSLLRDWWRKRFGVVHVPAAARRT